ncbi:MAG: bifunctional metallophosphatase/5'-nucleotidase [Chloroflexi bacterium]|nr:MAG: bifunctional metallophosphatase/5'-nucleotidase [Chloroflexota bacterium]
MAILSACTGEQEASAPAETAVAVSPVPTIAEGVAEETAVSPTTPPQPSATPPPIDSDTPSSITILYTNDEHGWMEGIAPEKGAAQLMGLWGSEEAYDPEGPFLVLSGGDMWTGPAISTWFDGVSMVEVMNSMGYAAAAIGNHEFDFGLDALLLRSQQADFPFLSANIRYVDDGSFPKDLGIEPYTIVGVGDMQVGIIGLTTQLTPQTTNPANVAQFKFIDYTTALREVVPQVKEEGADLILVPGHICRYELEQLANAVADLGIHLLGGGHCNELFADEVANIVLLEGGSSLSSYAFAEFFIDAETKEVVDVDYGVRPNAGGKADPMVEAIVAEWQAATNEELAVVIGYTEIGLERRSQAMQDLTTEAWLWAYPTADVAITNLGGMRADLPPGDIELSDIITIMPFDNVLIELTVSGSDLRKILARAAGDAVGGMESDVITWSFKESGDPLDPNGTYSLLVNSFMYAGGDDYTILAQSDPTAYDTGIDWRQPVIDWILAQDSSTDYPIDEAINALGR